MTSPQSRLDLDQVQKRYYLANDTISGEIGETDAEYWQRANQVLVDRAWDSVEDVPALLAEIQRLRTELNESQESERKLRSIVTMANTTAERRGRQRDAAQAEVKRLKCTHCHADATCLECGKSLQSNSWVLPPAPGPEVKQLQIFDADGPVEEEAEVFDRVEPPSDMPMLGVRWTDGYQMLSWGELLTLADFYDGRLVDVTGQEVPS